MMTATPRFVANKYRVFAVDIEYRFWMAALQIAKFA